MEKERPQTEDYVNMYDYLKWIFMASSGLQFPFATKRNRKDLHYVSLFEQR